MGAILDAPSLRNRKANKERRKQAYNVPSPNEMVVDTGDYVSVEHDPEKDQVAIINPDNLEQEAEQLQDLPLANDRKLDGFYARCASENLPSWSCD
jgi:ubiquitin carboxyl-terminal hydrolase 7